MRWCKGCVNVRQRGSCLSFDRLYGEYRRQVMRCLARSRQGCTERVGLLLWCPRRHPFLLQQNSCLDELSRYHCVNRLGRVGVTGGNKGRAALLQSCYFFWRCFNQMIMPVMAKKRRRMPIRSKNNAP